MTQVNIHYAKTHLSRLLEEAARGKEIVIAKAGKPIARLVAVEAKPFKRKPGRWKGMVTIKDNFDDPLPPELAKAFGIE
jgi:prevent-host-death family protein